MFELFFGIIWIIFSGIITFGSYSGIAGKITVNGRLVSQEEFNKMLAPKIFISVFWVIGIFFLIKGLRKIIINISTDIKGEECFGKVCNIYESGTFINNRPEFKADVLIYIPSTQETKIVSETIGLDFNLYRIGSYVKVKYYNNDINFEESADNLFIPENIKYKLENAPNNNFDNNFVR